MVIPLDSETSIQVLVDRARGGDRRAFDEIARRYQGRLERQVRARMGRRLLARLEVGDILQETFTAAFESIAGLAWQGEEALYRWLAGIAERRLQGASRKKVPDAIRLRPGASQKVAAGAASPSKLLRRAERFDRLENALQSLGEEHRKVLILSRVEGLKLKDVAARMQRSPEAVRKLLARALLRLRKAFGDTESLHLPDRIIESKEDRKDG